MADDPKPGAQAHPESAEATTSTTTATTTTEQTSAPDAGKTADGTPPPTGQKPAGESTAAATDDGKTPASKVPATYDLKTPDGGEVFVDDRTLDRIKAIGKASNWSNEDAQAALEEHIGQMRAISDDFLTATKADKDYGGDKLAESQRFAKTVIDRVRPEGHARRASFLGFLNRFGGGNHIEVLSFLADLGKQMGEDRPIAGRASAPDTSAASRMYDHPTSQAADAQR
jgi:hypothetical protein